MTTLAFFGEPRTPRLSKLLQEFQRGEILIPRFQRPFVWTYEQRLALMESIHSGYPIGAILIWRTQKHRLTTYDNLGPLRLLPDAEGETTRQYLLDGHQRMATLFAALGPGLYGRENQEPSRLPENEEERASWPIYFDLEADKQPFRLPRKREKAPSTWLPLESLFDSYALREFEDALKGQGYDRKIVNRVQSVAEIFRDYLIPVMPIATEDLEQVTRSFKRVNSGGTPMSEVHMVNALVHSLKFDLLKELDNLTTELKPVGWEDFDQQMILNVCKARLTLSLYNEEAETIAERLVTRPDVLLKVRDDIIKVAGVLDEIAGVRGPACLPYSYQAVLLADALQDVDVPSPQLLDKLRKWFWSTTLTEYFRGMTSSLFERARLHLHEVVKGTTELPPPMLSLIVDAVGSFDFRSARSRAIGLLLAEQTPVDPGGHPSNPFDLLAQFGVDALSKLFTERDVPESAKASVSGPENRFLISPRNARHLNDFRGGPGLFLDVKAFETHAISGSAVEALRRNEWVKFLQLRRLTIEDLERSRAQECGLEYRSA